MGKIGNLFLIGCLFMLLVMIGGCDTSVDDNRYQVESVLESTFTAAANDIVETFAFYDFDVSEMLNEISLVGGIEEMLKEEIGSFEYQILSENIMTSNDTAILVTTITSVNLLPAAKASVLAYTIGGEEVALESFITYIDTASKASVIVDIHFVKENDEWVVANDLELNGDFVNAMSGNLYYYFQEEF